MRRNSPLSSRGPGAEADRCGGEAGQQFVGARAGHFVEILCRSEWSTDPLLRRPLSIYAADPDRSEVTVLVRPYGRGSAWLVQQPVGTVVDVLGPLGNTFAINPKSRAPTV